MCAVAGLLVLPAAASAAEPWGAARLLAEDGMAAGVALDDRGLAVAAFTERRGPRGRVRAARAPAGRAFGRPFALAASGGLGLAPQVVFAGRTAAVSYPRGRGRAELRLIGADGRRSAAAVLGRVQRLSPRGESTLGAPALSVGLRGDAIAAWPSTRGVRVARRPR